MEIKGVPPGGVCIFNVHQIANGYLDKNSFIKRSFLNFELLTETPDAFLAGIFSAKWDSNEEFHSGIVHLDHELNLEKHKFTLEVDPNTWGSHLFLIVRVDQEGVFKFKTSWNDEISLVEKVEEKLSDLANEIE